MATEVIGPADAGVVAHRISWGALFAGAFAAIASWALLSVLGMAIGLSTVDQGQAGTLRFAGVFSGWWGAVSALVALFVGGLVAARASGTSSRGAGALHGFVTWALTAVAGAWLVVSLAGSLMGGLLSAGKVAVQAGGAAVGAATQAGGKVTQALGLDADDAVAPINQRLQAEGRPTITAQQLQAAAGEAVKQAASTGRIDREQLVQALSTQTNLSRDDAEALADRVQAQLQERRSQATAAISSAKEKAAAGATRAADVTAKAMWGAFVALLLGLIAAVGGGLVGVRRVRVIVRRAPVPEPEARRAPSITGREVYP
jgi:hypothetical protein